ncbi:MAG: cysteine hydrolase family protein [Anaerolineae bacterium]|jgi:nicotinamidase-related amidase|nr:cysteine hydrolase family protein [Anaerolineae bacterium]
MPTGLLIIDIQNDYFPGGKMELEGSDQAAKTARQLLNFFRARHLPVFHIQHLATRPRVVPNPVVPNPVVPNPVVPNPATFFLPGTSGAEIHPEVQPLENETVVQKHFPNSFRETELLQLLQQHQVQRLAIAGMMTHMCVDATVRAATDHGFECLIAHDACATRALNFGGRTVPAPDVHAAFLAALNGTYGKVLSTAEIIAKGFDDLTEE